MEVRMEVRMIRQSQCDRTNLKSRLLLVDLQREQTDETQHSISHVKKKTATYLFSTSQFGFLQNLHGIHGVGGPVAHLHHL